MRQSGGLSLAAGLDGGNTSIFIPIGNENAIESVRRPAAPAGNSFFTLAVVYRP